MLLSWLHQWVKNTIPANKLNRRAKHTAYRSACRRTAIRPMLEHLEERRLLSGAQNVQLQLYNGPSTSSYSGVGFQENQVAVLYASVNNQPDPSKGDFAAKINWGDGQSSTGGLVYTGTNGSFAMYQVKGSHTYDRTSPSSGYAITVNASGPDGTSISSQTSMGFVSPMPSGIPGAQPNPTMHSSAPENVQLQLYNGPSTSSYSGVGFQENQVAVLYASVNNEPDTTLSDCTAQINWGDDASWDKADLVYLGENGSFAMYQVKGSHTYEKTSPTNGYQIVVFANGPDGTSTSSQTAVGFVAPMPSGIPGTQPSPTMHASAPENVQLQLYNGASITATAGVAFQNHEVATLYASVNNEPDTTLSDCTAQINWGDGASWDKGSLVYMGTNGSFAMYQVKGSHTYEKISPTNGYQIVVFANGPDGTSTSSQTAVAFVSPNPNPSPPPPPSGTPALKGGIDYTENAGQQTGPTTLATFTDGNGDPTDLPPPVINWGDGTPMNPDTTKGTIQLKGGITYNVNGSHTYKNPGVFKITVTWNASNGSTSTTHDQVTVKSNPSKGQGGGKGNTNSLKEFGDFLEHLGVSFETMTKFLQQLNKVKDEAGPFLEKMTKVEETPITEPIGKTIGWLGKALDAWKIGTDWKNVLDAEAKGPEAYAKAYDKWLTDVGETGVKAIAGAAVNAAFASTGAGEIFAPIVSSVVSEWAGNQFEKYIEQHEKDVEKFAVQMWHSSHPNAKG